MKKHLSTLFIVCFSFTAWSQSNWVIDKNHSDIGFSAVHMVISEVTGEFKDFDGTVSNAPDDFNGAKVEFSAKVSSINTDNERRDNHLKGDDFFNAEQFPEVKFSGKIVKEADKHYLVGLFTMRDVTKDIKFDVKHNGTIPTRRGRKAGFKISGVVNRFDYGVKFNRALESGGLVVSEDITITCNIELNEKTEG